MNIEVKQVASQDAWEDFLLSHESSMYTQSWNYGVLASEVGDTPLYLGVYNDSVLQGVCLAIHQKSKRGSFILVPYGPLLRAEYQVAGFRGLVTYLSQYGRDNACSHVKISPFWDSTVSNDSLFVEHGFVRSPLHVLAETTWLLDVTPSEDELMAGMRKNTRNLIRRAIKDGVEIRKSTDKEGMERFLKLHDLTVKIHNFVPFKRIFFEQHLYAFKKDTQVEIFEAWHEGTLLASAVVMYYGSMGSYRHGASMHSKVPAAYLLQWEAIKEAKRRGCKNYNFWGIYDGDDKKHPFYGISFFKKGFGGVIKQLLHCRDLPLSWKYWLFFYVVGQMRRLKRGFYRERYHL